MIPQKIWSLIQNQYVCKYADLPLKRHLDYIYMVINTQFIYLQNSVGCMCLEVKLHKKRCFYTNVEIHAALVPLPPLLPFHPPSPLVMSFPQLLPHDLKVKCCHLTTRQGLLL